MSAEPEQVVCVADHERWWTYGEDGWYTNDNPRPVLGSVYTVVGREGCECGSCRPGCVGLVLAELGADAWDETAFRPVRRTSIAQLTGLLRPALEDA